MEGSRLGVLARRGLGGFVCGATLLPLIKTHRWWVRAFDFPRTQLFALGALYGALVIARRGQAGEADRYLSVAVGAALAGQFIQIYPFTRLARREVVSSEDSSRGNEVSLLCSNVLEQNRNSKRLVELIGRRSPDIILLTETDHWWDRQLRLLSKNYPFHVRQPIDNTYGMTLYSRLELVSPEVRFLVHSDIPSISAVVKLRDGRRFRLIGVRPRPPATETLNGNLRGSGARDTELVLVAKEVREEGGAAIVAGDFNDVAWSHTTRLFKRIGRMLDPRVGRGFYNTFPVQYPFLRYPLDHLFHTEHFKLNSFERLPSIGSDHFPILVSLRMTADAVNEQEPTAAEPEDFQEARETVEETPKE